MYTANQTSYTSSSTRHGAVSQDAAPFSNDPYTSYQQQYPQQPQMMMQPEMLSAYNGDYGYQSVHTPTTHNWWNGSGYGSQPCSPWTTTRTNSFTRNGSNASAGWTHSPAQQPLTTHLEGGKKYRYNPYACSEPSTPPTSPLMPNASMGSHSSDFGDASHFAAGSNSGAPVYDRNVMMGNNNDVGAMTLPVANNLEDQFTNLIGTIAHTACTTRGRTLLLNIIRMQHLDKIQIIFSELCASFGTVINDPQGCHVLRFIVEYLQETHIADLCQILTPALAYDMCTLSQHSRRVLQCLVEHHKTAALQPLVELICTNGQAIAIAKTQQGCIAIMRMLENVITPLKDMLFHAIAPAFAELSVNQFGNYTVQTAIQLVDRVILSATFEHVLKGRFAFVSCNKFGSNAMEKIVQVASPALIRVMLDELCFDAVNLHKLINDGFGNFVLQGLVERAAGWNGPEGKKLCELIQPLCQSSPYCHKIEGKLRSLGLLPPLASKQRQSQALLAPMANDSNTRSGSTQGSVASATSSGGGCSASVTSSVSICEVNSTSGVSPACPLDQ